MRRFELVKGKSSKFWEMSQSGASYTVRYGRIGTKGQSRTKKLASKAEAAKACAKLIEEKVGKGYVEIGAAPEQDVVREVIERHGGADIWLEVQKLVRPGITIAANWSKGVAKQASGGSRFGGTPDMPAGEAWPTREDVPMEFVAQIDCADIASLSGGLLPSAGLLLFFRSTQWAFDDDEKGCCRVIFVEPSSKLTRAVAPKVPYEDEFAGSTVAPQIYDATKGLSFAGYSALPIPNADDVKWNKGLAEKYAAMGDAVDDELSPSVKYDRDHRMLGYYPAPDYCGVIKPTDVRLLTVASEGPFTWGDSDRLNYVIKQVELNKRDFSKVRLYLNLG